MVRRVAALKGAHVLEMPAGRERLLGVDAHLRDANRLVDLGCGDGSWLDEHPAPEAIGIDITESPKKPAADRTWTFISADLDEGIALEDGWADAVRANQVIEHIRNPVRFLSEVRRILRPSGVFVATTPNIRYARHLAKLALLGEGPMTSGDATRTEASWDDGHIHFFTARDLEWLAKTTGFSHYQTEALIDRHGGLRPVRHVLDRLRRHALVKGFLTGNLVLIARK